MTTLDDGQALNPEESIAASLVGTAVDYLSRFMDGSAVEEAFEISLLGARAMRMEAKAFGLLDDKTEDQHERRYQNLPTDKH